MPWRRCMTRQRQRAVKSLTCISRRPAAARSPRTPSSARSSSTSASAAHRTRLRSIRGTAVATSARLPASIKGSASSAVCPTWSSSRPGPSTRSSSRPRPAGCRPIRSAWRTRCAPREPTSAAPTASTRRSGGWRRGVFCGQLGPSALPHQLRRLSATASAAASSTASATWVYLLVIVCPLCPISAPMVGSE